ncbi:MAG TPA: zf-HC2 domain-containing protein [Blastococcus sp.]
MSIPESHLAQEAIAALVDGELPAGPAGRAARHLSGCLQCRLAVDAQREAKEALHGSRDVTVPGDLVSRLCAIPFTTDVPGSDGGAGSVAAGPTGVTVSDGSGSWSYDLEPQERPQRAGHARWLRRGVTGTMIGLGAGVAFLALNLPAGAPASEPGRSVADRPGAEQHTEVVPPVVRTVTVGTSVPGGTP